MYYYMKDMHLLHDTCNRMSNIHFTHVVFLDEGRQEQAGLFLRYLKMYFYKLLAVKAYVRSSLPTLKQLCPHALRSGGNKFNSIQFKVERAARKKQKKKKES